MSSSLDLLDVKVYYDEWPQVIIFLSIVVA